MRTADGARLQMRRAVIARALVTAWHCEVRLWPGEADDARRLAADGRLCPQLTVHGLNTGSLSGSDELTVE